jgi:hypothetical protein
VARERLTRLGSAIDDFRAGGLDLDGIQAALQIAVPLLAGEAARAVRLAEADLEEIRHTRLLAEQRPAALHRLEELRAALAAAPRAGSAG